MLPNTIQLISHGRYEEFTINSQIQPGMMLIQQSNGGVIPHNVPGGNANPLIVALENALIGGTITSNGTPGNMTPATIPAKGDKLLMTLKSGQNVTLGQPLMSAGDGSLMLCSGPVLNQILTDSSNVSNTASATAFSNGNYTIPANMMQAGDVLKIRGKATVLGQNGTDTHNLNLKIGSTTIESSGAQNLAANATFSFNMDLTVRSVGTSGVLVGSGTMVVGLPGPNNTSADTVLNQSNANVSLDTTANQTISVQVTQSTASTGNIMALNEYQISLERAGGFRPIVQAAEACDNSSGNGTANNNATFFRVLVI